MKRTIFNSILIFVFCFSAFAQANENSCQKIIINAPEDVRAEEIFKISASYEKESQPSISKFNWIIVNNDKISKKINKGIIEINAANFEQGETLTIIAESTDKNCVSYATAKVFVIPNCGLVMTIDEYSKPDWNDEKARLDNIWIITQSSKDMELFAFFAFDKKSSQTERKDHLTRVFNYLSATRRLKKQNITFLISESDQQRIWYQLFPKDSSLYSCDECFIIRGEDLEKINNLFKPKPTTNQKK